MSSSNGNFVWYELMTTDADAAESFYRPVSGWGAREAGGLVRRAAQDIPGTGRFASVTDPQGAAFVLFTASGGEQGERPAFGAPGFCDWRELHAGNWEKAFEFYSGLFGWQKADAVDMGPMGTYQLFSAGDTTIGGMMTRTDATPAPAWLYYFNTDDIEQAAARVRENHGRVLNGPHEVPGGSWIIQCLDPQGVMFAMSGPHR